MLKNRERESVLNPNFVDADFFVNRIREFERKFGMEWDQFLAKYSTGNLTMGRCDTEYAEWSFLCHSFMPELLKHDNGPPVEEPNVEYKKPEPNSGFFFCWG